MLIAYDLDDSIGEFFVHFLDFHNAMYGTILSFDDLKNHVLSELLGISNAEAMQRLIEYYDSPYFNKTMPQDGAFEVVSDIKHLGHIQIVITARHDELEDRTKLWVDTHFPGIFADVILTNNAQLGAKNFINKSAVCKQLKVDFIIEDSGHNAMDCANNNIKVLLLDKPWNRIFAHENITRIYSFKEILDYI